jgi:hypothetical protein
LKNKGGGRSLVEKALDDHAIAPDVIETAMAPMNADLLEERPEAT